ncbi:MAG: hypothetical protein GY716_21450, partial [bacterium]|nr:hypothetical protein [bacterium]
MTDDTRDRTEIVGWVLLAVALALVGFCTSSSDAAEQTRHISQDLVIGGTSVTVGRNEAGDICLNWNGDSTTDETWCWDDIDGRFEFTHGQGSLWFAGHTLTLDRNSSKPVIVLSSGGTARAAICTGDSTGDVNDFKIGDGTCNPYWIYVDSTDGQVRIANETATTAIGPKGHLEIEGSVTTEPTLFVRIPDSQTDNGIEIRDSDNSNRTIFDQHGLIGSAEKDGSGNTCDGGDQTGCWKEPMILRSYNADSDGEVGSETEPAFVFQQMDTTNESSGNLVEYRVDVPTTTGEGESGTLSAYMTQGGSQYRDVGGTAYLVADELSDPNWIGTHEFQSPGAVQFEI